MQRELALLALRRAVSCTKKYLEVHNQPKAAAQSIIYSQSILTSSISSIKEDDVSVHDSGLDMNEVQGLKEENRQLKLENVKLKSELLAVEKKLEYKREVIEEAETALEDDENIVLTKELRKRDLDGQAKDIVSAVICNSLHETFNEYLAEHSQRNTSLVDELDNLKIQMLDQNSKIVESVSVVENLKEKCKMHENQESLLTLQLGEANNAVDVLQNELALKNREIKAMELKYTQEIRKLSNEKEEKVLKESLKNQLLEQEIARLRTSQVELEETNKEMETRSERMQLDMDSKEANIKQLHEQLTICCERLYSHEIRIEELLMKKRGKRRGLRKLLCC